MPASTISEGPGPRGRAIKPRQEKIDRGNCRASDDRRRRGGSEDKFPVKPGRPHRQRRGKHRGRLTDVDQRNAVQIAERESCAARPSLGELIIFEHLPRIVPVPARR